MVSLSRSLVLNSRYPSLLFLSLWCVSGAIARQPINFSVLVEIGGVDRLL